MFGAILTWLIDSCPKYSIYSIIPGIAEGVFAGAMVSFSGRIPKIQSVFTGKGVGNSNLVSPEAKERFPHGSICIIFIDGVPIKQATNIFPGLRYISSGVSICCKLPLSIIAIRSPRVSASVWS